MRPARRHLWPHRLHPTGNPTVDTTATAHTAQLALDRLYESHTGSRRRDAGGGATGNAPSCHLHGDLLSSIGN